jgi:NDP-sugar pyrophosphorylase family protein
MKAMIFAAGLGTRMRPLTNNRPKALVEVEGKPLLEHIIQRLIYFGVREIIVNVHYEALQIVEFLEKKDYFGIRIEISDESEQLLDTGGGLKKAMWFFDDDKPFLVWNTDILSTIDFEALLKYHNEHNALATLATRHRDTSRYLLFDENNVLHGWTNIKSGVAKIIRHDNENLKYQAFSGIHIISPRIKDFMTNPNVTVFSMIDLYLEVGKTQPILSYPHDADLWMDVGTPSDLEDGAFVARRM